ncbi:MAG: LPS assembly protein LptD [Geobacteraceae bacterium]|nr:LPS assembly protein LptD [Geobacteraceae bacterium]
MKLRTYIFILFLLLPTLLQAAEQTTGAPGMTIRADVMTHDAATDLIKANGKVEMTWQDMTMTADEATFNRTNQTLVAKGNVYLVKAGDVLWGDHLTMDTETGRAEMENGQIFMTQGNFRANGKPLARLGEDSYALRNGGLTTCDAAVPSWKFGASDLDVKLEEFATGKNVIFYVKDVPVFYFPYIILPVKRERQSGLLFPKFGRSTKRGEFVDIPFYWAISPSQEATIDLDIQTKRGIGLGVAYRYLRNRTREGSLGGYLIYDNNEKKERGQLVQFHKEQFSDSFNLITSLNLTSDRTYLSDYGEKSGEYNRQYYDSRIVLTKFWDHWLTSAQTIYTQDFYSGSNTTTLQRAPELSLYGVREKLPFIPNLYFDLDLLATNYYREKGADGQRGVMEPRLTSVNSFFNGRLNLSLFGSLQLRGYNTNKPDPGIKDDQLVAIPKAGAELSSSFSRIYDASFLDLQRLRHELVPKLSYLYVGEKDQSTVPVFDQLDRVNAQETVTLSLASHLGGRIAKQGQGAAEYRDLQTIRLLQSYNLSGTRPNLLTLLDDSRRWSDLILESETWAHRNLRLLADVHYSHYDHRISSTASGAELNDQRGNTARLSYRMVDKQVDYLEAGITLALTNPFYLGATTRYSFEKKDILENNYSVEYRHQCWSVIVGYQERPNNRTWTVNFNLAGLFGFGTGGATGYRAPTP